MKDGINFVLTQGALEKIAVTDIAAHNLDGTKCAGVHHFALGNPVAYDANNIRAGFTQTSGKPTSNQAGGARDQSGTIPPKRTIQAQTFHGALPDFQRSFNS